MEKCLRTQAIENVLHLATQSAENSTDTLDIAVVKEMLFNISEDEVVEDVIAKAEEPKVLRKVWRFVIFEKAEEDHRVADIIEIYELLEDSLEFIEECFRRSVRNIECHGEGTVDCIVEVREEFERDPRNCFSIFYSTNPSRQIDSYTWKTMTINKLR